MEINFKLYIKNASKLSRRGVLLLFYTDKLQISFLLVFLVFIELISILAPLLFGVEYLNELINENSSISSIQFIGFIVTIVIFRYVIISKIYKKLYFHAYENVNKYIETRLFKNLLTNEGVTSRFSNTDVITAITGNYFAVAGGLVLGTAAMIVEFTVLASVLVYVQSTNSNIMLLIIFLVLIYILYSTFLSAPFVNKYSTQRNEAEQMRVNYASALLDRAQEYGVSQNWSPTIDKFKQAQTLNATSWGALAALARLPRVFIESVLVLVLVGALVFMQGVSVTDPVYIALLFPMLVRTVPSLARIMAITQSMKAGLAAFEKMSENLHFKKTKFSPVAVTDSDGNLRERIRVDEPLTLVSGQSGVGKSTFISLQARNFNIGSPSIFYSEKPDVKIFFTSQQLNLSYFTWREFFFDSETESIQNLLLKFELNELVEFVLNGKDNKINFASYKLSGGQTQRLFIIRALLSGADIIILDESLSGIPRKLSQKILAEIINDQHRCVIYIGHDFFVDSKFTAKRYTVIPN